MNVLATKNTAAGIIYLPVAVGGVIIVAIGSTSLAAIYAWPVGALIAGIGIYHFVRFCRTPSVIIYEDESGALHLPHGAVITTSEMLDVSYRKAHSRAIEYSWGKLTIKTHLETYTYDFVADCESVAKRLTDMMYRARYSDSGTENGASESKY